MPSAMVMKKVSSGTSATSVAASADGADISPQYANAYETPKFTRPNTITPGSAAPCGSVMRRTRARMKRSTAAIAKRSPAPKNGGNSRLLKRTATKFDPPMSTTARNASSTLREGRDMKCPRYGARSG